MFVSTAVDRQNASAAVVSDTTTSTPQHEQHEHHEHAQQMNIFIDYDADHAVPSVAAVVAPTSTTFSSGVVNDVTGNSNSHTCIPPGYNMWNSPVGATAAAMRKAAGLEISNHI